MEEYVYEVTMPDGSCWVVAVMAIARNRAAYYAHEFGGGLSTEETDKLKKRKRQLEKLAAKFKKKYAIWIKTFDRTGNQIPNASDLVFSQSFSRLQLDNNGSRRLTAFLATSRG